MLTQKEQQGSTIAIRENQLFGDWLMQQGCISHEQLDAALADQKKNEGNADTYGPGSQDIVGNCVEACVVGFDRLLDAVRLAQNAHYSISSKTQICQSFGSMITFPNCFRNSRLAPSTIFGGVAS